MGSQASLTPVIVIDLDGPVLDTRHRHHTCYAEILGEGHCQPLDPDVYWRLKRARVGAAELLKRSGCAIPPADFERRWLGLIERAQVLALDVIQLGALQRLRLWKGMGIFMILSSMRRHTASARRQLHNLGLAELFTAVVFCSPSEGPQGKASSVLSVVPATSTREVWIGDTEIDIEAARLAGFRSVAVTCGIRSRTHLLAAQPDLLVPRLSAIRRRDLTS
jgi:phosphoglycolate phosphatase